jgi:hypothetical protein
VAQRYREGDWFAVPLPNSGFAVGVIARVSRGGVLLGYFFGPIRKRPPALDELAARRPSDACWTRRFGHLGLAQGTWPVIGRSPDWSRTAWPMPVFGRFEELTGRAFEVHYADEDPLRVLREVQVEPAAIAGLPSDGLAGHGFAEASLEQQLRSLGEG